MNGQLGNETKAFLVGQDNQPDPIQEDNLRLRFQSSDSAIRFDVGTKDETFGSSASGADDGVRFGGSNPINAREPQNEDDNEDGREIKLRISLKAVNKLFGKHKVLFK